VSGRSFNVTATFALTLSASDSASVVSDAVVRAHTVSSVSGIVHTIRVVHIAVGVPIRARTSCCHTVDSALNGIGRAGFAHRGFAAAALAAAPLRVSVRLASEKYYAARRNARHRQQS